MLLQTRLHRTAAALVLMLLVVSVSGCNGCRKPPTAAKKDEEEAKKKREKPPLPPLTISRIRMLPNDRASIQQNSVKPGHWISTVQSVRANHRDMQVAIESYPVDTSGRHLELDRLSYRMTVARPGALPKGQARSFEAWDKIPRLPSAMGKTVAVERRIRARRGGREEAVSQEPTTAMPDYQYFFVVLAEVPDQYAFMRQRMHALQQPRSELSLSPPPQYYRVMIPPRGRAGWPLPTHPLTWTSTATVLWDSVHPSELTPPQQQALLDWLHWGGQLIVSGPGSLEKMAGSFLEPYLPASREAAVEWKSADFAPLDEFWSLTRSDTKQRQGLAVLDSAPVAGVQFALHPQGNMVEGCGELVAERRVGAGRVVLTAFPLTHRVLLTWPCYDNFFNGALLRHPGRVFRQEEFGTLSYTWRDRPALTLEPRYISMMRYLSRDASYRDTAAPGRRPLDEGSDWRLDGYQVAEQSGIGGWNDFSATSNAARDILREAAGISIPDASFVLRTVAIYLLVLTPLNWGFFRLIGRVEWAWAAAPIIAVVASVAVVRLAQLDIGFARSRTEVATLEIQAGYPRAHLTRYTALYTSLSTNYELAFAHETALAQPMPSDPEYRQPLGDPGVPVRLERDRQVRLNGFSVISNSTGLVHSEQMFDLAGTMHLTGDEQRGLVLENGTLANVQDAAVFRRRGDGTLEVAWVGQARAKTNVPLKFEVASTDGPLVPEWDRVPILSGAQVEPGGISLRRLVDLVADDLPLRPGDARLVGWSEQDWEGQAIRPNASQIVSRTLVVAHLERGRLPPPERDENLLADFKAEEDRALSDDDLGEIPADATNNAPMSTPQ